MEFESSPSLILKDSDIDSENLSLLIQLSGSAGKKADSSKGISFIYRYIIKFYLTYLYQPVGKINNQQPHVNPWHHCSARTITQCPISAYSWFSGSIFHVFFQYKMRYYLVSKKNNSLFMWGSFPWDHHLSSLGKPRDHANPGDGFFYPIFTLMLDSYNLTSILGNWIVKWVKPRDWTW